MEILRQLNQHMGIIMVSHDLGFVSSFVRTVVCVNRRVVTHPTSEITGEVIADMYGGEVHMVRHDHAHDVEHALMHDGLEIVEDEPHEHSHDEGGCNHGQ